MMSLSKNVTFCDMWKHADLNTLGHFVSNQDTFTKLALSDVSCCFSKSMPISKKQLSSLGLRTQFTNSYIELQ